MSIISISTVVNYHPFKPYIHKNKYEMYSFFGIKVLTGNKGQCKKACCTSRHYYTALKNHECTTHIQNGIKVIIPGRWSYMLGNIQIAFFPDDQPAKNQPELKPQVLPYEPFEQL